MRPRHLKHFYASRADDDGRLFEISPFLYHMPIYSHRYYFAHIHLLTSLHWPFISSTRFSRGDAARRRAILTYMHSTARSCAIRRADIRTPATDTPKMIARHILKSSYARRRRDVSRIIAVEGSGLHEMTPPPTARNTRADFSSLLAA